MITIMIMTITRTAVMHMTLVTVDQAYGPGSGSEYDLWFLINERSRTLVVLVVFLGWADDDFAGYHHLPTTGDAEAANRRQRLYCLIRKNRLHVDRS
jgi:hypothetical protein